MLKGIYLLIFISFLAFNSLVLAQTLSPDGELYSELLERHKNQGHLNGKEVKDQQFKYSNNKSWQKSFNNQVRGVASSLKIPREKIQLNNPPIEISVK